MIQQSVPTHARTTYAAAMARKPVDDAERPRRAELKERHQELSRSLFLDAAEVVFGRKGFHDSTLKEVAQLAEFSVGSIYSFFAGKEDLFAQMFVRRGAEFQARMREILAPGKKPPLVQLAELVDFQVGFFREHRHFSRVFLRHANVALQFDDPEIGALLNANTFEAMALQADLFRRGQLDGVFRSGDPAVLARLFSGIISAFQAVDPAVVSDDDGAVETFALDELQALIGSAFTTARPRAR
jgi:TetR/AcrR family transcriptional regulator